MNFYSNAELMGDKEAFKLSQKLSHCLIFIGVYNFIQVYALVIILTVKYFRVFNFCHQVLYAKIFRQ